MNFFQTLLTDSWEFTNYVSGIISSADYKINTSVLEGVNNKIKQIKRRAYGFRDDNYFFLKVKAAFPGLP